MVALNIVKVAVGLGFVIFLHELGHFLLAKWNGVKVEKFSIGFGPTLLGMRRGETEYVLAAIPLGGFVKMLGEGPEEEANKSTDPRAYPNKTVGARMAIISAGVIMNVLLGMACFVYAYGQGMDEMPARLGSVKPGSPGFKAGLRPGDEIVAIDGRTDINWLSMTLKVSLSGAGQSVNFLIKRPGHDGLIPLTIEPKREGSEEMPRIGVGPSMSLELNDFVMWPMPGLGSDAKRIAAALQPGDILKAIGPDRESMEEITNSEQLRMRLMRDRDRKLVMRFHRPARQVKGVDQPAQDITVDVPPVPMMEFGFRLTAEPISSIRPDSPASAADFRIGDRIVSVNDNAGFDPLGLPEYIFKHAGETVRFEIDRPVPGQKEPKRQTIEATPDDTPPSLDFFAEAPLEIPGLGLAFPVRTKIAGVLPGSPAAKAGLKPNDAINKIKITFPKGSKLTKPETFEFSDKSSDWLTAFYSMQVEAIETAELTINGSSTPVKLRPEPNHEWHNPSRGLRFETMIRRLPPQNVQSAMRRGFDDTVDNILRIYAMLRSLAQRRVSPKLLGGPIMIASVAYRQADTGLTELVHFLGILSINLAVLNFLPVPPLDGGQMVFLIAEKVRGRPLPVSAQVVGSWVGVGLLLCLMVYVFYQDITRIF